MGSRFTCFFVMIVAAWFTVVPVGRVMSGFEHTLPTSSISDLSSARNLERRSLSVNIPMDFSWSVTMTLPTWFSAIILAASSRSVSLLVVTTFLLMKWSTSNQVLKFSGACGKLSIMSEVVIMPTRSPTSQMPKRRILCSIIILAASLRENWMQILTRGEDIAI